MKGSLAPLLLRLLLLLQLLTESFSNSSIRDSAAILSLKCTDRFSYPNPLKILFIGVKPPTGAAYSDRY